LCKTRTDEAVRAQGGGCARCAVPRRCCLVPVLPEGLREIERARERESERKIVRERERAREKERKGEIERQRDRERELRGALTARRSGR